MDTTDIKHGTTAIHKLGDISRPEGDFFYAERDDGDAWIGQWLTGFGFVEVRFPKDSVRELTDDEREWLATRRLVF